MTSVLSPLAKPFRPVFGDVSLNVCNDGVPSLTSQASDSEFLHLIPDDTIDEAFPLDAQEAAELEMVDVFVGLMATLALLEEKEEATRSVHAGLRKRWEARRELVARPHSPKNLVAHVVNGADPKVLQWMEIVAHDHSFRNPYQRPQGKESLRLLKSKTWKNASAKSRRKPIQQPRKHN